ncbi:transcriptional regulator [Microtetraspora sp. NBRC 13810]|uniref:helix-turn-helix domain-containing protein n=1 Tax=Microtetraspora sp. NBRC 13810 TaxID=3030990 RepID=UPI0024A45655|nr:helix-turn-helix transcriptional regulator [Microtetraspora sp. NBRC 13810]GLW05985.1 transcriptional regulator [Microtetraspora sp. NBRC 13810]
MGNSVSTPEKLLGAEIRRLRHEQGISQEHLAAKIQFSPAMVGFVERGERTPTQDFVARCEAALGARTLQPLWGECAPKNAPRWFRPWTKIEAEARTIRIWEPLLVPGLLQTHDYARAVLSAEPAVSRERVEELLKARIQRQNVFDQPSPPVVSVLIDEGVLYRPVGGVAVMHRQLEHLVEMMARPCVTVQVVPVAVGATAGLSGAFALAQVAGARDAAYLDNPINGQVTDREDEVHAITLRFDAVRAWAHPQHVSEQVIREMKVKYEPQG